MSVSHRQSAEPATRDRPTIPPGSSPGRAQRTTAVAAFALSRQALPDLTVGVSGISGKSPAHSTARALSSFHESPNSVKEDPRPFCTAVMRISGWAIKKWEEAPLELAA
jgi:hypothetical protein